MLRGAGADVNAVAGDGKTALALAIFNGNYEVASFLVDSKADVNKADAQRFTPLFWAVDRRNMETAPNFPWMVTADPLPLIRKLLDAGANPNALVNNTPRARMREGSPRIVFATALMRAAFSADLELVKLLLAHGADPKIISQRRRNDGRGRSRTGLHPGLPPREVASRAARGGEAVRRARRRREPGRRLRHHAADGRRQHGRHRRSSSTWSTWAPISAPTTWARRTTAQFGASVEPLMPSTTRSASARSCPTTPSSSTRMPSR